LLSLVLGVIELVTLTFVILWIAVAGLITTVVSVFTTNIWTQVIVLAVASAVLLIATRPLARKWRGQRTYRNRLDELVGREGVVVNEGAPGAFATVRVQGELWSARSTENVQPGDRVKVTSAHGTVLDVVRIQVEQ
jgi:membrane protein implicated in regulation of membrane protease activity